MTVDLTGEAADLTGTADELVERGNELNEARDFVGAEACYRAALQFERVDMTVWNGLGYALSGQGRVAEALDAYRRGVALGDTNAHLNIGLMAEEIGDLESAAAAYRAAIDTGDPRGRLSLGWLWREHLGDADAARTIWLHGALEGDPHCAAALGVWLYTDGDADEAEPLLRQGYEVNDDARADLARILRAQGASAESMRLLAEGAVNGGASSSLQYAARLEDQGDLVEAEAVLRRVVASGEINGLNNLGLLLRDRGAVVEAREQFRLGAERGDSLAAYNLARLQRTHRRQLNRAYRRAARTGQELGDSATVGRPEVDRRR